MFFFQVEVLSYGIPQVRRFARYTLQLGVVIRRGWLWFVESVVKLFTVCAMVMLSPFGNLRALAWELQLLMAMIVLEHASALG